MGDAVDERLAAAADRDAGALIDGLAGADVEERVGMGARHLGALLARHRPVLGRDEHEVALAGLDEDVRVPARLRREVALGHPHRAPLLADEAREGRRQKKATDDGHA